MSDIDSPFLEMHKARELAKLSEEQTNEESLYETSFNGADK